MDVGHFVRRLFNGAGVGSGVGCASRGGARRLGLGQPLDRFELVRWGQVGVAHDHLPPNSARVRRSTPAMTSREANVCRASDGLPPWEE
jgi:hypothetical protein